MDLQVFLELSSSFINPKYVGLSPFLPDREKREEETPPRLTSVTYEYSMCIKRAMNTRIIGFGEPSLKSCADNFSQDARATQLFGKNDAALEAFNNRRKCKVDPFRLPWEPRKEYIEWLKSQNRLLPREDPPV